MTDTRDTLMRAVQADLERINGTSPYTIAVAEVTRNLKSLEQLQLPAIVMVEGGERTERTASGRRIFRLLSISLVLYLPVGPAQDVTSALDGYYAEVLRAMVGTNPDSPAESLGTHGDNAFRTIPGNFDPFVVEGSPVAVGVADFELHFARGWNQP